jgi:RNA polymerase primary sigma factor
MLATSNPPRINTTGKKAHAQQLSATEQAKLDARFKTAREGKIAFMPHPEFEEALRSRKLSGAILAPMPPIPAEFHVRRAKAPAKLPPYLSALYDHPLLTREQEGHLFRKMNYLKFRACWVREHHPTLNMSQLEEIEGLLHEATEVRKQIIASNLRLVVSIAKRYVDARAQNLFELISDANYSLMLAAEKFDFARGNKFSTYASWDIMKNFHRTIPLENTRRSRFQTGQDELERPDEHEEPSQATVDGHKKAIKKMLARLDVRERMVIVGRFGLYDNSRQTLEAIGKELGVTKERVRQLETRAMEKLRLAALEMDP